MSSQKISLYLRKHFRHFNALTLIRASDAYRDLIDQNGKVLISLAGAMSTAEIGLSLAKMIRQGKVHAISCTGANLEEDIYNLIGNQSYKHIHNYRYLSAQDEENFIGANLTRITDTCIPDSVFDSLAEAIEPIWVEADRNSERLFPHEFMFRLLQQDEFRKTFQINEEASWLIAAMECNIPIFVAGWEDSTLGNQFAAGVINKTIKNIHTLKTGIEYMMSLVDWYQKTTSHSKVGFFQIGGGIAGDFAICVLPLLKKEMFIPNTPEWAYFCQISDSTTSYGSYSGAVPNEKISWGKLTKDTPSFIIESDATIVAPLMFAIILDE